MRTLPLSIALVAGGVAFAAGPPPRQPVYVGARACGRCHERQALGNQYGHWLLSKHAQAYAALAKPEAKPMARLSGITDPPEKAPVCLGCHATAADAEPWERDPGFVLEDGVQCEKCHGAGSEYMEEAVMRDPEAARKAGLRKPTKHYCLLCHYVKGSHVDVHRLPPLDIEEAWKRLAHPTHPEPAVTAEAPRAPPAPVPAQADSGTDHWNAIGLDAGYKTPMNLAFESGRQTALRGLRGGPERDRGRRSPPEESGRDPGGRPAGRRDLQPRRSPRLRQQPPRRHRLGHRGRLAQGREDLPGRGRAPRPPHRPNRASALRPQQRHRRHLGRGHRVGEGAEAAGREPQPLVARPLARTENACW